MKTQILSVLLVAMTFSAALAGEVLEGKSALNAKCSVRMELDKDLIAFAGDGVAFGFMVEAKTIEDALKKGQKLVTVTGVDGPISARLSLNFSDKGILESANYSQKTFRLSKRVKCTELE